MGVIQNTGAGRPLYAGGTYTFAQDTSFVTGDSPVTVDVKGALGYAGIDGWFTVDGAGDIQIEITDDGTTYGDPIIILGATSLGGTVGESFKLTGLNIWKLRITWSADTAYRYFIQ